MYKLVDSLTAHLMKATGICSFHQYHEQLQNIKIVLLWFDIESKGLLPSSFNRQHLTKRYVLQNKKDKSCLSF